MFKNLFSLSSEVNPFPFSMTSDINLQIAHRPMMTCYSEEIMSN